MPPAAAPAWQAGGRWIRDVAGRRARSRGGGASESGPPRGSRLNQADTQRDSGPARAGHQRRIAAASRRVGPRVRQHCRRPLDFADAARALHVRGPEDQPARRGRSAMLPPSRRSTSRAASGRTSGCMRTCRQHARRHAHSLLLPARRRVCREGPPPEELYEFGDSGHRHPGTDRRAPGRRPGHTVQHRWRVRGVGGPEMCEDQYRLRDAAIRAHGR